MNGYCDVYKHSGKIGPAAYMIPVAGIISAIILSFIYAYITVYSPVPGYISIIFVLVFALSLGFVISKAGFWGKCRNQVFLNVSSFLIGTFALYFSWIVFIYALFNQNGNTEIELGILRMFISPGVIWDLIQSTNETGWYSILSWTPSGSALWTFWGIEAIIIVAVPIIISSKVIDSEMFCEKCSDWCVSVEALNLAIPDDDELLKEIKKGDAESLADLDRAPESEYSYISVVLQYIRVALYYCNGCNVTAGYKLKHVTKETGNEEKEKEKIENITGLFVLPHDSFEKLSDLSNRQDYDT